MNHKNNIFADKGHEFLTSIANYFDRWTRMASKEHSPIQLLRSGRKIHINNVKPLVSVLDCITNRYNVITLASMGHAMFDGYFILNFDNATVEFTPMGAWQVSLLLTSTNIMPLYWHANYMKMKLILSEDDLRMLREEEGFSVSNHEFIPSYMVCTPSVRPLEDGKSYEVIYHYWSEFGGYSERHVILTCHNGFGSSCKIKDLIIKTEDKNIYPYRAPIMF